MPANVSETVNRSNVMVMDGFILFVTTIATSSLMWVTKRSEGHG